MGLSLQNSFSGNISFEFSVLCFCSTVHKMNLILHSMERRSKMQFSMAHKFTLQLLRRYKVKHTLKCMILRDLHLTRQAWRKLENTTSTGSVAQYSTTALFVRIRILLSSVTDPDPESGAFLTAGSRIRDGSYFREQINDFLGSK
jgi:hypothetical protein